jgi:hypothetical protein
MVKSGYVLNCAIVFRRQCLWISCFPVTGQFMLDTKKATPTKATCSHPPNLFVEQYLHHPRHRPLSIVVLRPTAASLPSTRSVVTIGLLCSLQAASSRPHWLAVTLFPPWSPAKAERCDAHCTDCALRVAAELTTSFIITNHACPLASRRLGGNFPRGCRGTDCSGLPEPMTRLRSLGYVRCIGTWG